MEDDLWGNINQFLKEPYFNEPTRVETEGILTDNEVEIAMLALLEGRGEKGAEEEEIYRFVKWVEAVKLNNALLTLMFKGFVYLDDPTGTFAPDSDIHISLTEKGKLAQDDLKSSK